MSNFSRKILTYSLALTLVSSAVAGLDTAKPVVIHAAGGLGQSSMLNVDYDSLVSQADLYFNKQVTASYLGMPIGNGRTGGLVWTEPTKLKTQVNRVDVFGHNGASSATSIHGDYFGAVGNLSVDFGGTVFPSNNVPQYLSMYNATENIQGTNLTAEVLAWSDQDVIAIQVNDTRSTPTPINIDLGMTRSGPLETKDNYSAASVISQNNGKIVLTQKFEEPTDTNLPINNFYNMSAAVIDVAGRTATASQVDAKTMRLSIPASTGSFTILIGSAASMNSADDVTAIAMAAVDTAKTTGYANIYASHTAWWHNYWAKSFVSFPAVQGTGYDKDYGSHFFNFYYLMASCFRGTYPAKFNGLLFNTANGGAQWGTEYWIFNDSRSYYGLETGNHSDLLDPFLNMINKNLGKYQTAAQQQWGAQGLYIPETSPFDGPEVLPDAIATSLQNSLLNGLDLTTAVKNFRSSRIAGADSRWTIDGTGGQWKSGWHSHLVYDAADVANMFWDRYLYTQDLNYLRNTAYPVIKGAAEFYRTFPNLKKGADNKYHIYKTGLAETIWGADDILNDLNYIRGLLPTAIKAAQLLNVDSNLIPMWQDIIDNLAPNPLSSDSNSILKRTRADGKPTYAMGRSPIIYLLQNAPTVWDEYQVELLDFDQVNLESKANGMNLTAWDLNMNTFETQQAYTNYMNGQIAGLGNRSWSRFMTDAARLGRSDMVKLGLASNLKQWESNMVTNPNRLPSTNGGNQTMSVQEDGVFVEGMQNGLLQSLAKGPGESPVIYAFGAWPTDIDAAFQLQAKKGFTVTASQRSQNIEFVEVYSSLGRMADVNNPWGASQSVDLYRNGVKAESLTGRLLSFQTAVGEDVVIVKTGTTPSQYQRTISYAKPIFVNAGKTTLQPRETTQLSLAGSNVSGTTISYSSSNSSVASVNSNGLVTANADGSTLITVTAMTGSTLLASGQITINVSSLVNDTDSGITYSGSFSYSNNRNLGDYANDVHQTSVNNNFFQYTFTGTGIDYIGVKNKNNDIGDQDVYIDGVFAQTVNGAAPSYAAQSVIYSNKSLAYGTHTIKVVKKSGNWMVLDGFKVYTETATFSADITAPTNQDVTLTIIYPDYATVKEYKVGDNGSWTAYIAPVVVSANDTVYARIKDAAGNMSNVTSYTVGNIDKAPPADATLSADVTALTNMDVTVTISYPSDVTVMEYKVGDKGAWTAYGAPVVVSENSTVYARGTDAAGNVSNETGYTVSNIDHIAPIDATLAIDTTAPTNEGVTVTISYPADASFMEYKVGASGAWTAYTAPVIVSDNDTVYARGIDAVGNVSNVTSITVSNIYKIAPVTNATLSPAAPNGKNSWYSTDVTASLSVSASVYGGSVTTEYQVNDGEWIVYTGSIPAFGDGTYKLGYRSKDQAGNLEQLKTVEFKVDKTAPALSVQLDKTSIWPANHKMVTINVLLNSSDTISNVGSVVLTSITSNQSDSSKGDIQADFGTAATSFSLRAEKSRIYTITYTATDKAGNKTVTTATVTVPHDQSGNN
ncbi:hypothetical protein GC098_38360 [Paenibacillus sp. LMG 31458]|uniref:BIG2 domain-containing protein n=1 Tax=Paenibacillus phytorum TaxID=2654977 RepID=A0ABX1YAQ2_9BACL|nr:Ig-like domain-containing protein [Paenibacillus phytorum]NOU77161.1 hypothetical protein [Paenibacillus phytorum]